MGAVDMGQVIRHGAFALVAGIVGACASIVLCLVVNLAYEAVRSHPWLLCLLPVFGVLSLLLYHWFKLPLDTTTHTVVTDIREDRKISPLLAPGILAGTALSILGGASVGKEAGALHMGASLGNTLGGLFKLKPIFRKDRTSADTPAHGMDAYAAATGMAATFAALFFAPLGSAMFVLELTRYKRSVLMHLPSMLAACFIAYLLASSTGIGDVIPKVALPQISWSVAGQCMIIGVACAVVGTLFIKSIDGVQRHTEKLMGNYYLWVFSGGVIMIALVLGFGWQDYEGTGASQLALALSGEQAPLGFAVKALLTVVCLGLWFRGGEIMPTFTIGALLGASCTVMTGGEAGWSAAVGLVAFFAAMSRCPLAAFLMGCEIFGWAGAPLYAIAAAVSLSLGKDVGYYGEGVMSVFRDAYRRNRARARGKAGGEKEKGEPIIVRGHDALAEAEQAVEQDRSQK